MNWLNMLDSELMFSCIVGIIEIMLCMLYNVPLLGDSRTGSVVTFANSVESDEFSAESVELICISK